MKSILVNVLYISLFITLFSCKHDATGVADLNQVDFKTQVLPIYINNCTMSGCHGTDGNKRLKLTDYQSIVSEVTPGKPYQSNAYTETTNAWSPMPPSPRQPLSQKQRSLIYVWILQGAKPDTISHK